MENHAVGKNYSTGGVGDSSGWLLLIAAILVLCLHAGLFLPFLTDDALISLRYAQRLLDGKGLTWTDAGPPVEGYSNLLWVLLSAALGRSGMDLVLAVRVLGFVAHVGVLSALAYRYLAPGRSQPFAFVVSAMVLALAPPVAAWTVGGLEQPLVLCLLMWAIVLLLQDLGHSRPTRHWIVASTCLALLCLTRPDGPIYTATAAAGLLLVGSFSRSAWWHAGRICILPVGAFCGQLAFRLSYYGEWVPNTALVKITPSTNHLVGGLAYLGGLVLAMSPAVMLGLLHVVEVLRGGDREERGRVILIALPLLAWGIYVVWIGGDIFPAWRHGVPLIGLIALLCGEALRAGTFPIAAIPGNSRRAWALAAFGVLYLTTSYQAKDNRLPYSEDWEWDNKLVGEGLKRAYAENPPTIAVDAAGAVPYWSGFPAIDMLGLNDYHIARTTPEDLGEGRIGHEKGDGAYVFSLRPDMVLFNYDMEVLPVYRSGVELFEMPEFLSLYPLCRFVAPEPEPGNGRKKFYAWVRRDSPSLGYHTDESGNVHFPVHFFTGIGNNVAHLGHDGRVTLRVKAGDPATFRYADIEPGRYRVVIDADGPVQVTLIEADTGTPIAQGTAPLDIEMTDHPTFDHHLAVFDAALGCAEGETVTIVGVTFQKITANGEAP